MVASLAHMSAIDPTIARLRKPCCSICIDFECDHPVCFCIQVTFFSEDSFNKHFNEFYKKKTVSCEECKVEMDNIKDLIKHREIHLMSKNTQKLLCKNNLLSIFDSLYLLFMITKKSRMTL